MILLDPKVAIHADRRPLGAPYLDLSMTLLDSKIVIHTEWDLGGTILRSTYDSPWLKTSHSCRPKILQAQYLDHLWLSEMQNFGPMNIYGLGLQYLALFWNTCSANIFQMLESDLTKMLSFCWEVGLLETKRTCKVEEHEGQNLQDWVQLSQDSFWETSFGLAFAQAKPQPVFNQHAGGVTLEPGKASEEAVEPSPWKSPW